MGNNQYVFIDLIQLMKSLDELKKQGCNPDKLKITIWHGVYRIEILENDVRISEMDAKYADTEWAG